MLPNYNLETSWPLIYRRENNYRKYSFGISFATCVRACMPGSSPLFNGGNYRRGSIIQVLGSIVPHHVNRSNKRLSCLQAARRWHWLGRRMAAQLILLFSLAYTAYTIPRKMTRSLGHSGSSKKLSFAWGGMKLLKLVEDHSVNQITME